MSLLNTLRNKQQELERLKAELARMENSEELKQELEFQETIKDVLETYGKTIDDALRAVSPNHPYFRGATASKAVAGRRKPRATRRFTNPHTGESFETKGGNHTTLKQWKEQYGSDEVEGWAQIVG